MIRGAAAVIRDASGRILLIREHYDRRRYGFPGGRIEPGEQPADAVVREVREETCVDVIIDWLVGVYELPSYVETHLFACTIVGGSPTCPAGDEIAEVDWFAPDEIPDPRTNLLHHALTDVLAGARGLERRNLERVT